MTAGSEIALLHRLADAYHVMSEYVDMEHRAVAARPESLLAALRALGAPVSGMHDVGNALRRRQRELWEWRLEPVVLAWDGSLPSLELRAPAAASNGDVEVHISFEDGGVRSYRWSITDLPRGAAISFDEDEFISVCLPLALDLPFGYHALTVTTKGRELRSVIISAPKLAYQADEDRSWGVFLPLYALHSHRSWGIGDFADLKALLRWASAKGARFVGTLPLLPTYLDTPYEPSPYVPVSRLFWNEIFIDLDSTVTGLQRKPGHHAVVPAATVEAARRLNAREPVPHREVMTLKRRVLEQLTRLPFQGPAANEAGQSLRGRPALADYAAFRAAAERRRPPWRSWPEGQRRGSLLPGDYDSDVADFYALAQILASEQIQAVSRGSRERGTRLYLDLPVGVHPDGYDAWRYQDLFAEGMNVGAPPDLLATHGQDWGFAPLIPESSRDTGYEYVRAYFRHHLAVAGMLRIDHAIGLHRMFWIPHGASGKDGVFVRQPAEEMYAILSLESHRHQSVLVGENLGLVPPEVDAGLMEHGISRMYVQLFELTGSAEEPATLPQRDCVAAFATHDLPPFAAYWSDADLEERRRLGLTDSAGEQRAKEQRQAERQALLQHLHDRGRLRETPEVADVYRGATRLLAESEARRVMLNLEDAWGETRSQNIPGTTQDQNPNWSHRARYALEDFDGVADLTKTLAMMRELRPGDEGSGADG